jgi:hypothetical protein
MLCFIAAVVILHPPLNPISSTITDAFFCWHSLACRASNPLLLSYQHHKPLPQLSSPLHHVHLHNQWLPPTPLACDVMQCLCQLFTHCVSLLLLLRVMFMCQWYCNIPPAGSAAVAGSIGCFFVSVVQFVSNISCRDALCMLCFVAAVVVHPPHHPTPSTITDAFFCWHLLAPALSC